MVSTSSIKIFFVIYTKSNIHANISEYPTCIIKTFKEFNNRFVIFYLSMFIHEDTPSYSSSFHLFEVFILKDILISPIIQMHTTIRYIILPEIILTDSTQENEIKMWDNVFEIIMLDLTLIKRKIIRKRRAFILFIELICFWSRF